MTEEQPWMTGYLDQVEAIAAELFQLEGERREADMNGDTATASQRGKDIFAVLDNNDPEHLRMFIRMILMTVELEGEEDDDNG